MDDNDRAAAAELTAFYRRHFHDCCRWLRAMGVPESELEDVAQEVFLVAQRRFAEEDRRNPAGWLYRIAWRTASDQRRRAWWKGLFQRRRDVPLEDHASPSETPAEAAERAERWRLLERILARMSAIRRTTFVLFEIEGYSGEEIAALQAVPLKTVWTRLHHARRSFLALADAARRAEERRTREPRR